jgi:hypothetical protein
MAMVDFGGNHAVEWIMAVAASLRQLLAHSIDYAGLFPPCSLELKAALTNQAGYARAADEWMLSTFVLPVARFDEASDHLSLFDREHPLALSALGPKAESGSEFVAELKKTVESIQSLSARQAGVVSVQQLEMALPRQTDEGIMVEARGLLGGGELPCFWESHPTFAEETIDLLAEHNSEGSARAFGFKLRTGGVTADAFPTSQQIARALVVATQNQVPIKFTAGLHHPIRQHREEVQTKMHGFLNVLGAGVMAAQHRWDEKQTTEMLECEEARAFSFDDEAFQWREWKIGSDQIATHRKLITSFGSCSFDEPREDLAALGFG